MRRKNVSIAAILAAAAIVVPANEAVQSYKVLIHETNSTTSMTKDNLSKCFLKQGNTWINGLPVIPVDQAPESQTRARFSQEVHGREVTAIKSYWQRQVFSGRAVPPVEKTSDQEVIDFVRATPGAIGYVSTNVDPGSGVKVLRILNE